MEARKGVGRTARGDEPESPSAATDLPGGEGLQAATHAPCPALPPLLATTVAVAMRRPSSHTRRTLRQGFLLGVPQSGQQIWGWTAHEMGELTDVTPFAHAYPGSGCVAADGGCGHENGVDRGGGSCGWVAIAGRC